VRLRSWASRDDGNVSLLTLGLLILVVGLVLVSAAATKVHLQAARLGQLADEAALDAADALDDAAYFTPQYPAPVNDGTRAVELSGAEVTAIVQERVNARAAELGLEPVVVTAWVAPDGSSAVVTLGSRARVPFGLDALAPWQDGVAISATGTARTS